MSTDTFETSLGHERPPQGWSNALQALWWDANGNWDKAHSLVQLNEAGRRSAWVHAYLHRKEGDLSNAAYWYRRSGQPMATGSLINECRVIAASLLEHSPSAE